MVDTFVRKSFYVYTVYIQRAKISQKTESLSNKHSAKKSHPFVAN